MMLTSCRTPACSLKAFTPKADWPHYDKIAIQKHIIFRPDENDRATQFWLLADRIDYLEAYGESANKVIGE